MLSPRQEEVLQVLRDDGGWMRCWIIAQQLGWGSYAVAAQLRELRRQQLVTRMRGRDGAIWIFG